MQTASTQILMIEDDDQDVEIIQHLLDDMPILPFTLNHRKTLSGGINMLQASEAVDLILLDLSLPDAHGLDTFHQVHQAFPEKPLIILSGNIDPTVAEEALQEGAQDFLVKGCFDSTSLGLSIQHALETQKHKLELELQNNTLNALSKQLELARSEIQKLATIDALTQIYNRTGFDEVFLAEWERLQREEKPLALILCELDANEVEFDLASPARKDQTLQQLTEVMLNVIKRPVDCVARYSEEQFMVLLPNTDILGATFIAEAIRTQVQRLHLDYPSILGRQLVTLSFGVTGHIPKAPEAPSLLVEAATQALKGAKVRGRHQVNWQTLQDTKSELYTRQTLHWVGKLHQAFQHDLFQLYVQPIHSLNRARGIEGFDVLLRLCDQSGRVCAPEMFLPIIEQYDFMAQIDQWLIEHLLLEHTQIYAHQKFEGTYFIKLSEATCKAGNLAELVQKQLNLYNFPAKQLCFVMSESVAIKHLPAAMKLAKSLKVLGCQIAVDNFGVDIQAFRQLKLIEANYVKIKGELINGINTDPILYGILGSINRVANVMNSKTIARQVRSSTILNHLYDLGIDYAQGTYFERAIPFYQYRKNVHSSSILC
ncbi:EAL domain-containing protein [Acaryochloris marina NIES-2412]|uniref:EAL domain-containing protein n=1 Tax=Acaryochloris marina TaxID=155978 RepID=UPI0040588EA0